MRTVVRTQEGVLELNYMWLPTWIGMNTVIKPEIERELSKKIVGMVMSEDSLDAIHGMVIDHLVDGNPHVEGLRDYLDGLKFVHFKSNATQQG